MGGGRPYGYKKVGEGRSAHLVIDEVEGSVVKRIFELYVHGRGDGSGPLSFRQLAEVLDNEGCPAPNNAKNNRGYWTPSALHWIIKNEIYAGRTYFGKTTVAWQPDGTRKTVHKPREEWLVIDVPELALVDRATWEGAQYRMERNRELAKRNGKREYLLSGFFRCGRCGYAMGSLCGDRYVCSPPARWKERQPCSNMNRTVLSRVAEQLVWEWLTALLSDDTSIDRGLQAMKEQAQATFAGKHERLSLVDSLIDKADAKINRLIRAFGNDESGDAVVLSAMQTEVKNLARQREALKAERNMIAAELAQHEITPAMEAQIKAMAAAIRQKLPDATFAEKRYVMDKLDVRVIYQVDEEKRRYLEVSCGIPGTEDVIAIDLPWNPNHNSSEPANAIRPSWNPMSKAAKGVTRVMRQAAAARVT